MSDNKNKGGSPDNRTIDLRDSNEIRNWCRSFGCSENELNDAVQAVGKSASKVREYLSR